MKIPILEFKKFLARIEREAKKQSIILQTAIWQGKIWIYLEDKFSEKISILAIADIFSDEDETVNLQLDTQGA